MISEELSVQPLDQILYHHQAQVGPWNVSYDQLLGTQPNKTWGSSSKASRLIK